MLEELVSYINQDIFQCLVKLRFSLIFNLNGFTFAMVKKMH